MTGLVNRHILLGVTGGIAAYKAAELVRLLRRAGAEVRVVMTRGATEFVTPLTFQALSGHPVRSELFDAAAEAGMDHIELARWADLVLVAPASADFLARLAGGRADDLLTTLCLATAAPIAVAPAMNRQMWQAAATRDNVQRLTARGVHLFGPGCGEQACGEVGPGRMLEPAELLRLADELFAAGPLAGVRALVTAGPTREAIDPVRFISNRSSGKMGFAVAAALAAAGAEVVLVAGPVALPTPSGVRRIDVESAQEMLAAVEAEQFDLLVATAAVADYRPAIVADAKLKKEQAVMTLEMTRNPDVLATISAARPEVFTVGFAAETNDLERYARDKLAQKGLDMIAANWVGAERGFETEHNALQVFWAEGGTTLEEAPKTELARQLVALISTRYAAARQS
ncbi:MAG: bifunctional phosphopantothenoylcysteine decarboxylase/phosphopantothenate--cysteine ligase CoaBC [Thiohalomonadaceae bacterium]